MSKVSITRSLLDDLAVSISTKSGEPVPMTLTEMKDAVDGISSTTVEALSVTSNGTYTAPTGKAYTPVTVNVSAPSPSLQSKTVSYTPTESAQTETVSADSGYDGLSQVSVSVGAISNTYVGTGITRRSSSDLTASGATVTVPSGYYSAQASKAVASGTAGTPTATKGTVSNHQISVTPSVTNTTGWITGSTKSGTAVTVTASELASGNKAITQNGTGIDVVGYSTVSVDVAGAEYTRTVIAPQQTASPSSAMEQITLTSSGLIEDAKDYIVTLDGVEWLTTCETLWTANYCIGDVRYFLEASPSSAIYPFGAICEGGIIYACFATTGSHTIKIERLDFVTGGTTLTTKDITANGTYNASSDSADGYSSVTVNVPSGSSKNTQVVQGTTRTSASALTAIGAELTVSKTGTYDIYYSCFRTNTSSSYTWATRLYINGTAYGTAENATWTNNQQNTHLSNISLTANDKLRVYGRNTRGTSYYVCAPMLAIIEA